jgi:hypothetical protein
MKRLLEILILTLLTPVLVSGFTTPVLINNGHFNSSVTAIKSDTTGLIRLLKVDNFNLSIIPPSSGVQFYKNRIVFLSLSKNEMKMSPNQISFGAVEAYSAFVADSILGKHTVFSPLSSFSYPCEAMTFSHDYETVYFTMISKKGEKEKIYMAKYTTNDKNQEVFIPESSPLEFCSDNSSYSHPALSSNDNIMVFASDRSGSVGGMDLYVTRKTGEKWSDPENLGRLINTDGNEFFPFLDSENNLFFSSDRLKGYGGYDIFTCKFNGTGWDKPMNLSDRINSDKDDIAFTINKSDGRTAFFSRRQQSGNAEIQLFRIKFIKEVSESNPLTVSYIFNGKPVSEPYLAVSTQSETAKPIVSEPTKTKPEKRAESETVKSKTESQAVAEPVKTKPEKQVVNEPAKIIPEKEVITKPVQDVKPAENKTVTITPAKPLATEQKDVVVYKVQLLPDRNQINAKKMDINGMSYKIDEYLYLGAIRYTIGEFSSLGQAAALQRICRQSGYPQSFVIAFKNNTRSLDKSLFK